MVQAVVACALSDDYHPLWSGQHLHSDSGQAAAVDEGVVTILLQLAVTVVLVLVFGLGINQQRARERDKRVTIKARIQREELYLTAPF